MVLYADSGARLQKAEKFLDDRDTNTTGLPLRTVVTSFGGIWECHGPRGQYDTLNIPYKGRILVVERPFDDAKGTKEGGHRVSISGKMTSGLEDSIIEFFSDLLNNAGSYPEVMGVYHRHCQENPKSG